jgi:hypothetical protein
VQSGHPQIGRAGEAVMAAANDDRVEIGHCRVLLESAEPRDSTDRGATAFPILL